MMTYKTKFTKKIKVSNSGLTRDDNSNKPRYDLLIPEKMEYNLLDRWADLMARGAKKHSSRNWELACTKEDMERFKESAIRHLFQWAKGDRTEDHPAAVCFNLQGYEYVYEKLAKDKGKVVK